MGGVLHSGQHGGVLPPGGQGGRLCKRRQGGARGGGHCAGETPPLPSGSGAQSLLFPGSIAIFQRERVRGLNEPTTPRGDAALAPARHIHPQNNSFAGAEPPARGSPAGRAGGRERRPRGPGCGPVRSPRPFAPLSPTPSGPRGAALTHPGLSRGPRRTRRGRGGDKCQRGRRGTAPPARGCARSPLRYSPLGVPSPRSETPRRLLAPPSRPRRRSAPVPPARSAPEPPPLRCSPGAANKLVSPAFPPRLPARSAAANQRGRLCDRRRPSL